MGGLEDQMGENVKLTGISFGILKGFGMALAFAAACIVIIPVFIMSLISSDGEEV